jgi:hypothetical protein
VEVEDVAGDGDSAETHRCVPATRAKECFILRENVTRA